MNTIPLNFIEEHEFTNKYFNTENKVNGLYLTKAINAIVNLDKNDYGVLDAFVEIEDQTKKPFNFTYINNVEMELFTNILAKYNNKTISEVSDRIYFDGQSQKMFKIDMTNEEYFNVFMVYQFHRDEMKSSYKKYIKNNVVTESDLDDIGSVAKQKKLAQSEFTLMYLNNMDLVAKSDLDEFNLI